MAPLLRAFPAALVLLAASCSGDVPVDAPDLDGEAAEACRAFVDALPTTLGDQERRDVESPFAAAYGDPAIVVVCGIPRPTELMTSCFTVEGVDWYAPDEARDNTTDVVATTVGREPGVQLRVPAEYRPIDAEFVDIAEAVRGGTVSTDPCPT